MPSQVSWAINISVVRGERLVTRYEFRGVLETQACSIIQPVFIRKAHIRHRYDLSLHNRLPVERHQDGESW